MYECAFVFNVCTRRTLVIMANETIPTTNTHTLRVCAGGRGLGGMLCNSAICECAPIRKTQTQVPTTVTKGSAHGLYFSFPFAFFVLFIS